MPEVLADLDALVRIQSVSGDASRHDEVRRCARVVARLFEAEGMETTVIAVNGGLPSVLARRPARDGAPTVLLYAHYDVQPEGSRAAWRSDPFVPEHRGHRLYARGVADDKAGVAAHLAAVRAVGPDESPVGITVFLEGEEESGSPTLRDLLALHRDLLACDLIVIADAANWESDAPALTTSIRGSINLDLTIETLDGPVHSGAWGGLAPDALITLCRLLATLHDESGEVAVAGLRSPSPPGETPDIREDEVRSLAGLLDNVKLLGSGPLLERVWRRPAIDILGIDAPAVATAANVLVPRATARVGVRIPPGVSGDEVLAAIQAHLRAHTPWGARLSFGTAVVVEPHEVDTGTPAYALVRDAIAQAWGTAPIEVGIGGSIPVVNEFADAFPGVPMAITAVHDRRANTHGDNESLDLGEFERACVAEALLVRSITRDLLTTNTTNDEESKKS